MKIAIIGSGISGLVSAYRLNPNHDVTVFESGKYVGGHTNTIDVELDGSQYCVDTGFIVFNDWTYPNFIQLLEELKVASRPTTMSLSVTDLNAGLEYNGHSLRTIFAQKRNLVRPRFYQMLADIVRFNRMAVRHIDDDDEAMTVGNFLTKLGENKPSEGDLMAAELLKAGANSYAAYASSRFLEKTPDIKSQFGDSAFDRWKDHFSLRIRELSVAMAENEAALFLSRVHWARGAFHAREVSEDLLKKSLVCLSEVLKEELPNAFNRFPMEYISAAIKSFDDSGKETAELDPQDPISNLAMRYLLTVLEGNPQNAIKLIVDAHSDGLSIENTYQALIIAQREVGRMWHQAEVNIAEEHIVTSTTERAMGVLAFQVSRKPANGLTVVSAAVSGNSHDIGIRIVSDFFEFDGWRAVCLGGDLPAEDISHAVNFFDTSLVLLSAALSTQLNSIRESVQAVRGLNGNCKILVGGSAFQDTPELWQRMEADGYAASPADALTIGTRLVNQ